MYDSSHDPPSSSEYNAWTVLANTERWISETLAASETSAGNPYTRKEVSYACEHAADSSMIVASIFRRLKEVRELAEHHGEEEEQRAQNLGSAYEPSTLRQTQVVVIPSNPDLTEKFLVFDRMIETINQARRNARDYVTDVALEKLDDRIIEEEPKEDWSVSVNCAHLHPRFGEKTPEQVLQEMKEEEQAGEIDLHYEEYKEKRLLARRSPYPTIVIEVRAVPPPDFGEASPTTQSKEAESDAISKADIQKLEALFGKSAHFNHPTKELSPDEEEDAFYKAIGQSIGEVSAVTPLMLSQRWVAENDPALGERAAFTESDAAHVDAAYEFIFTNIAMLKDANHTMRQYLAMSHFLSSSATSFEKFSHEVQKMISVLPDLNGKVTISTFHPEHIQASKRSPVPIYVLEWRSGTE